MIPFILVMNFGMLYSTLDMFLKLYNVGLILFCKAFKSYTVFDKGAAIKVLITIMIKIMITIMIIIIIIIIIMIMTIYI